MDRRRKRLDAATAASAAAGNMIAGADVSEARESTGGASSGVVEPVGELLFARSGGLALVEGARRAAVLMHKACIRIPL